MRIDRSDAVPIAMFVSWVFCCAPVATAQQPVVAEPGARLRLTIASGHQRMSGQYLRRLADSLEFRWSDSKGSPLQQLIALRDIDRIEYSGRRTHPMFPTALKGAAMGFAFGVVAGRLLSCEGRGCGNADMTRNAAMVTFGVGIGAVGATIGIVRAAKGFDHWVPATVAGWQP